MGSMRFNWMFVNIDIVQTRSCFFRRIVAHILRSSSSLSLGVCSHSYSIAIAFFLLLSIGTLPRPSVFLFLYFSLSHTNIHTHTHSPAYERHSAIETEMSMSTFIVKIKKKSNSTINPQKRSIYVNAINDCSTVSTKNSSEFGENFAVFTCSRCLNRQNTFATV